MSRISLRKLSTNDLTTESLLSQLQNVIADIETQVNRYVNIYSVKDSKIPRDIKQNDIVISYIGGVLKVGIYDGKRIRYLTATDLQVLQSQGTTFVGHKIGTTAPNLAITRTTHFPNPSDWGYYFNSSTSLFYLFFNDNGTNRFVQM